MIALVWMIAAMVVAGLGCLLVLLGAVGLLRMPDVYMRMQAASKASALGAAMVLGGAAMGLGDPPAVVRTVVAIVFLCITMPVAAHVLGRAALRTGVTFSDETDPVDLPPDCPRAPEAPAGPGSPGSPVESDA
ncbi:MAG: monovalent cation/H(+) antiporter subunit G [Planctomycetota bacterium]